ncbi:MAG TPA: xanthine dehydrogenase family protein molybdopterin-binding subunit [Xanthobacteraceae bacterium]|nr:xanthine dehydrogenase family protein molybdopterin-binding subunit [Xanthobacteraceae bacterium]
MDAAIEQRAAWQPRLEDDALVRGNGRYTADVALPNQAYAHFVRSPHAFARILGVDVSAAQSAPGVVGVLTGEDVEGLGSIGRHPPLNGRGGRALIMPHRPALAVERVMHVGEAVAMMVAESAVAAQDAAELVVVEYEPLPCVTDARAALAPGAPQVWPQAPGNLAIDWPGPAADPEANAGAVDAIFAAATFVARVAVVNQRMAVASLEPRGATASYDVATDSYTLRVCSQGAGAVRDVLVAIMNVPKERLRVVTGDVGGAFGLKTGPYPEYVALMVAAKKLKRPVHWMSGRSEAFLSDNQARDLHSEAELALDGNGRFLALRVRNTANLGAYVGAVGAGIPSWNFTRCLPCMYDIKHIDVSTRCAFTNTLATAPYRGAGRPEANYVLERVVEEAARRTGIDPAELRRRNLIAAAAMPYKTAVGTTYDSGDFASVLDKALKLADYHRFKARRRQARSRGKYRGIGISCMLEHAGGTPLEGAWLSFPGDGTLTVNLNVQSTGHGHASVFSRLVADRLGIARDRVTHRQGDSAFEIAGYAAVGSRSAMTAGAAMVKAIDVMLERGKRIAAMLLEADQADIVYEAGRFGVVGTDRRIALFELAARAAELKRQGAIEEDLDTRATTETPLTFPNGVHIAEVEIDPQTGHLDIVAYTAVDDCGNVLDGIIVEGQLHGAVAQGLGQALMEQVVYDDSGQLVTGSFMDYAMPRAGDMPPIRDALACVPATTNPLGVKGVGEAGTTASIAALMNAVADAIPGGGGAHLDMPASAARLWQACQRAAAGEGVRLET